MITEREENSIVSPAIVRKILGGLRSIASISHKIKIPDWL